MVKVLKNKVLKNKANYEIIALLLYYFLYLSKNLEKVHIMEFFVD